MPEGPLLAVDRLSVHFEVRAGRGRRVVLRAVDDVSLSLGRGETLAIVGESGCGKSTLLRAALGLQRPTAGAVRFGGVDWAASDRVAARALRRRLGAVFQDPAGSLDPTLPVARIVAEPLRAHGIGSARERDARVRALLGRVGLDEGSGDRYPQELSGGQRQRVAIARAVVTDPDLLVADEPVSALDVSVRAQILALLADLRRERGLALLVVSHDLAAVRVVADRVAVLYLGRIVEEAPAAALFAAPAHPYSAALLAATPVPDPAVERPRRRRAADADAAGDSAEPPSSLAPPPGCAYHPRCPRADEGCREAQPALAEVGPGRRAACWHPLTGGSAGRPGGPEGDRARDPAA